MGRFEQPVSMAVAGDQVKAGESINLRRARGGDQPFPVSNTVVGRNRVIYGAVGHEHLAAPARKAAQVGAYCLGPARHLLDATSPGGWLERQRVLLSVRSP